MMARLRSRSQFALEISWWPADCNPIIHRRITETLPPQKRCRAIISRFFLSKSNFARRVKLRAATDRMKYATPLLRLGYMMHSTDGGM